MYGWWTHFASDIKQHPDETYKYKSKYNKYFSFQNEKFFPSD